MGLEFALVHDATKEAYDLGKWCGDRDWNIRPPTKAELAAYFVDYYGDDGEYAHLVAPTIAAVWAFMESHPGWRLVDEHDYSWRTEWPPPAKRLECFGEANVFRQVGSRYDLYSPEPNGGEQNGGP